MSVVYRSGHGLAMNGVQQRYTRILAALPFAALLLTLIMVAIPARAQTFTILDSLLNGGPGPQWAGGPLVQGRDGDLYGYSYLGGSNNTGSIWKTTPSGTVSVVYSFATGTGNDCQSGLTLGTDGNFYGSALTNCAGAGYVFKLTPSGTLTVLHTFTGAPDGYNPGPVVQYTDGNFYGITVQGGANNFGSVFKITPSGTLTTLYSFDNTNNFANPTYGLTIGADGNFYGTQVGANGLGSIYKMTPSGVVTVLHSFTGNPDGVGPASGVTLGKDGNFYGVTQYGGTNYDGHEDEGTFFKMTPSGTVTILHNFNVATDYAAYPTAPLVQATDGNFYGVISGCAEFGCGGANDLFKITPTGTLTVLEKFTGSNGLYPYWSLTQATNGVLYGLTQQGGTVNGGVLFSLNIGAAAYITLQSTSGKIGSKVGIFGQGFSSSSVVKFNGVAATAVTLSGTSYLSATVPTGASDGFVTVTTGSTTLTSTQKYTVHNSWVAGTVMPTGVQWPMTGTIGNKIYVVGGYTASAVIANNQIYNPSTNTWTSGAVLPTAMAQGASAVVNNVLYVFGGSANGGGTVTNAVWAYSPTTNTWTSKSAMPTARCSSAAVVEKGIVYVIGGYNGSRLSTVESYNPATDTWTEGAPLLVGKSEISAGLIGSTIVASGGFASGGVTGDTEGYNATTNTWTTLATDSVHRNGACAGAIGGNLYVSDGNDNSNNAFSVNESFNLTKNTWTTLTTMPQIVTDSGPAVYSGQLYCFGGSSFANAFRGTVYNNVQIYQP